MVTLPAGPLRIVRHLPMMASIESEPDDPAHRRRSSAWAAAEVLATKPACGL